MSTARSRPGADRMRVFEKFRVLASSRPVPLPTVANAGRAVEVRLRSVCKPHSVRRGAQVYARRLRPCRLASAIIHLCSLPETRAERAAPSSLLDLAPDGGYLAARIAANAGGLLHRLFTMTGAQTSAPKFVAELKHRTPQPRLLFSVALPTDFSVPGFPRRRALRSTDFPRLTATESRDRPTGLRRIYHTREPTLRQRRRGTPQTLARALWRSISPSARAPSGKQRP